MKWREARLFTLGLLGSLYLAIYFSWTATIAITIILGLDPLHILLNLTSGTYAKFPLFYVSLNRMLIIGGRMVLVHMSVLDIARSWPTIGILLEVGLENMVNALNILAQVSDELLVKLGILCARTF